MQMVRQQVKESFDIEVSNRQARQVLRHDCKLSFIKAKKLSVGTNTEKSRVLRQQYALRMLPLLESKTRIINIDETWLNESSFVRKVWAPRNGLGNVKLNTVSPRLSMIAALDTDGRVWFSLSHSNTDSNVMITFLNHLQQALDIETPGWQESSWLLWDNAPYHTSDETRAAAKAMGLNLIFSAPYSYSAAPIETLFSNLKLGEFNPERLTTGKR